MAKKEKEKKAQEIKTPSQLLLQYEAAKAMRKQREPDTHNAAKLLRRYTDKTKEEIIKSGNAKEMAALFLCNKDAQGYLTNKTILTPREEFTIWNRMKREGTKDEFVRYNNEFIRLHLYGKMVRELTLYYKMDAASLTMLVNEWEMYETQAQAYANLLQVGKAIAIGKTLSEEGAAEWAQGSGKYIEQHSVFNDARFVFDEASCSFRTDIDGKGMLYERIQETAEDVAMHLSALKAALQVAEEQLQETNTFYMPAYILEAEEITCERWLMSRDSDRSHYRSELNYRKLKGRAVSAEEEKWAVYPDYYELEPDEEVYENYKAGLTRK